MFELAVEEELIAVINITALKRKERRTTRSEERRKTHKMTGRLASAS